MTMTTTQTTTADWRFTDPASATNIIRTIRAEADAILGIVADAAVWTAPTAAGHWEVRDIVAHLTDNTRDILERFGSSAPVSEPLGLAAMAAEEDRTALAYRNVERTVLIEQYRTGTAAVLAEFEALSADDWTGDLVSHKFMGPLPKCYYTIFTLVDQAVHAWDIREGIGRPHALGADAADLLVPMAFLLWQSTADTSGLEPFTLGLRVGGRNGGDTVATVTPDGIEFASGDVGACPAMLEFDASSFVLTAEGRTNAGTLTGDRASAERFLSLFFRI